MANYNDSEYDPKVERILEHLASKNGPLKLSEQQGLIICIANELGYSRHTLTHGFDISGLFTTTMNLVQEMSDEDPVQRLLLVGLLKVITDQFLEDVATTAIASLSKAA